MNKIFLGMCLAACLVQAETKVGIIGLDTSHALAFTKIMNVTKDPGVAGFRVTAAYQWGSKDIVSATNRYPKYIAEMKKMGVEIVPTLDALIAQVDCICLETNDGREHFAQAEKVFKSGKRVFIDKPLAHNLADALKIYDAGKKYKAAYFSSSALRFTPVMRAVREGAFGPIRTCALVSPSPEEEQGTHNFYTWYGIHGFEPLVTAMGTGAISVSCFRNEKEDAINVTWKDGRMAQLHLMRKSWMYTGYIMPEKPKNPKSPVIVFDGYSGYEPLLREIIAFFKTGKVPVSNEETLEVMALMEAAEVSAKQGGQPVFVADVMASCRIAAGLDRPWYKFW